MARQHIRRVISLFRSKRVIISAVAAIAMVLGAMSVGAAVMFYTQVPSILGAQPAPPNPFPGRIHATSSNTPPNNTPTAQVAGAETGQGSEPTVQKPSVTPSSSGLASGGEANSPAESYQLQLPITPVVQPAITAITDTVSPIVTKTPLQTLINTMTNTLPNKLDTSLIHVSVPQIKF